jgi:hypothetical protein
MSGGEGIMGSNEKIIRGFGAAIILLIFLELLFLASSAVDTKTAYTRDGINFVSKERAEENIRYEYAKPGDYKEVQVPLNTIVVNASIIPENILDKESLNATAKEMHSSETNQTALPPTSEKQPKYPYASIGIGILIIAGAIIFVASVINGRGR